MKTYVSEILVRREKLRLSKFEGDPPYEDDYLENFVLILIVLSIFV